MGAIQSINYPNDYPQKLSANDLPEINVEDVLNSGELGQAVRIDSLDIKVIEKHFKNQIQLLKSYLNMYLLFDGYDNKNGIVIKDLEKKLINQKKELKKLYETKDKLMSNLDYTKVKYVENKNKKKIFNILIIIFSITLPIIFIFIINELRHYTVVAPN